MEGHIDIDIRDLDESFMDALANVPLDDEEYPELGSSDEDSSSETSERREVGAENSSRSSYGVHVQYLIE